jgi:hypothetical protein
VCAIFTINYRANSLGLSQPLVRANGEQRSLVCIGHSHVDAVAAAAAAATVPLETFNLWHWAGASFGYEAVRAVREKLSQVRAPVFSFVGGGLPQVFGMVAHPRRPYDFVLPERPDLPVTDGTEFVPYDALRASMQAIMHTFFDIMGAIRDVIRGPVFHMESPPPCEEEIKANDPVWNKFYAEDDVIAPIWFRYKVWRLHSELVKAYCDGAGIVFVPHPRGVTDARGFLDPAFRGRPGHGNPEYGALVLQQMLALSRAGGAADG